VPEVLCILHFGEINGESVMAVLAAVVLAAGESRRMGRTKAVLPDAAGRPFVARLVRTFRAAGIDEIVVVTGAAHDDVVAALEQDRATAMPRLVRNLDPARGQLSSLWVGLDAVLQRDVDAVLMTPVDVPMVNPATIRAVVAAWTAGRAPIVRPAIGDRHGHPVLFDRAVFGELRRAPLDVGAKAVVHVPVDDEGALTDIDTPRDYAAMVARAGNT
jgi:molybdenum cofactor cytidylyltransferase